MRENKAKGVLKSTHHFSFYQDLLLMRHIIHFRRKKHVYSYFVWNHHRLVNNDSNPIFLDIFFADIIFKKILVLWFL